MCQTCTLKNCKQTDFKVHVWHVVELFCSLEFHSDMKNKKKYIFTKLKVFMSARLKNNIVSLFCNILLCRLAHW